MTVKEILIEWLIEHGYSGLWNEDECGCPIDDLILCDSESIEACQPGYRVKTDPETSDSGYAWKIVSEKPANDGCLSGTGAIKRSENVRSL